MRLRPKQFIYIYIKTIDDTRPGRAKKNIKPKGAGLKIENF